MVKANGYGLGALEVAAALWAAGCRRFFVAHLEEGRALRARLPAAVVHVLNGLPAGTAAPMAEAGLVPVLNHPAELAG